MSEAEGYELCCYILYIVSSRFYLLFIDNCPFDMVRLVLMGVLEALYIIGLVMFFHEEGTLYRNASLRNKVCAAAIKALLPLCK